jgi:hypothetical protein
MQKSLLYQHNQRQNNIKAIITSLLIELTHFLFFDFFLHMMIMILSQQVGISSF